VALYQDPAQPRLRPSLIEDLIALPATTKHHALENQSTAVLAWLADRSPAFARRLVACFLGHNVKPDVVIGARTQISMPQPGGGAVFPDLSIDGSGGAFQVLVEVKVWSDFHVYDHPTAGVLRQDVYYRRVWQELAAAGEADVRAVGTLTREGGPHKADPTAMVAADVSWTQIADLLEDLLAAGQLEESVRVVAESFLSAVRTVIGGEKPDPALAKAWLDEHHALVGAVVVALQRRLGGTRVPSTGGKWFRAERLRLTDVNGVPLDLRVYVTPAGGDVNLPGWPGALVVGVERDTDGTLAASDSPAVTAAGFPRQKDLGGYRLHRRLWSVEQLDDGVDEVVETVVAGAAATGLLDLAR
jgi:hypothetical protein